MLAFAKDITNADPKHPEESKNTELKEYMDYQRKLNHERIVYFSLNHAKTNLQNKIQLASGDKEKIKPYVTEAFPLSYQYAEADTLILMLRKLINGHNATNNWYRMNAYYYALVFDSMKRFIKIYNLLLGESAEKVKAYEMSHEVDVEFGDVSKGVEIDFDDWSELFFPDFDFHIGKPLEYSHYPFAKRNKKIEEEINKAGQGGKSKADALNGLKDRFEIDDSSIRVLLEQKISDNDLELFYTSVENPIYEFLNPPEEGRWGSMEGESPLDQAYYLASNLKVWEWRKREDAENVMDEMIAKAQKK